MNIALNHEDPTKIGMTKTTGVLFSFILQYIFIGIIIDFLGIIGAALVISAIVSVMTIKIFENKLFFNISFIIFSQKIFSIECRLT